MFIPKIVNRIRKFTDLEGVVYAKRYIFIENKYNYDATPELKDSEIDMFNFKNHYKLKDFKIETKVNIPVTIVNISGMIQENPITKIKELVHNTNIYLGSILFKSNEKFYRYISMKNEYEMLMYMKKNKRDSVDKIDRDIDNLYHRLKEFNAFQIPQIEISGDDLITLTNSHYVVIYKPLDDYKYGTLENYTSFDHNNRFETIPRLVMNDPNKILKFCDPEPKYYNYLHQYRATGGDETSFIHKLIESKKKEDFNVNVFINSPTHSPLSYGSVVYRAGELIDEFTSIALLNTKIYNLTNLAEMISEDNSNPYLSPTEVMANFYSLFSQLKYDLDTHSISRATLIFRSSKDSSKKGWNMKDVSVASKVLSDDQKAVSELMSNLVKIIEMRYNEFFLKYLAVGYEFDLYMHYSININIMKIVIDDNKKKSAKTNVELETVIEEIDSNRGDN